MLICRRCRTPVRVYELPGPFIEPDLYVGIVCREFHLDEPQAQPSDVQLELVPGVMEETREYDPTIARIPF